MKKKFLTVALLCSSTLGLMAQLDSNRTDQTKIADALAALPANNMKSYNHVMKDLSSLSYNGLIDLLKMRNNASSDMQVKLDYAINSLSDYTSTSGNKAFASTLQKALREMIRKSGDMTDASFFFKQLRTIGTNESVPFIMEYVTDANLYQKATRALSAIDTPEAEADLIAELTKVEKKYQLPILLALGEMQAEGAEDAILSVAPQMTTDDELAVLYYALSRCGGEKSLSILAEAAEAANYTMDHKGATEAYIMILKHLGSTDAVAKHAKKLHKQAKKNDSPATQTAALQLLFAQSPDDAKGILLKALKEEDTTYRNAALYFAESYLTEKDVMEVAEKMLKPGKAVTADLLHWIARNGYTQTSVLVSDLSKELVEKEDDKAMLSLAIHTASMLGDNHSIQTLADYLANANEEVASMAHDALAYCKGNVADATMDRFEPATPWGKLATLQLLGDRREDQYAEKVLTLCHDTDKSIQGAAFESLRGVVTPGDLPKLFTLLTDVSSSNLEATQSAVCNALNQMPAEERYGLVSQYMDRAESGKKSRYYTLLSTSKDQAALCKIEDGLKSADSQVRMAAFEAITQWDGFEAAGALFTLCENVKDAQTFDKAYEAYLQKVFRSSETPETKVVFLRKALELAKTDKQKQMAIRMLGNTRTMQSIFITKEYLDQPALCQEACQAVMGAALSNKAYAGGVVTDALNKVIAVIDNPDAHYQKEAIKKYLNETQATPGYQSIFNGKDLSGWKGLVGNPVTRAKMTTSKLASAQEGADEKMNGSWSVQDGLLVFDGKGDNICTDKPYGNFEMYIDWKLYTGGKEADAGIYLRGNPQVQIWDTARVHVGAQVGSGGLYNNQKNMSKPTCVADHEMGEWNTFYIKMEGERVTVKLNGKTVVDNVIMENYWDRSQPIPMMDQIELQAHGSKVAYRDIYVRELPSTATTELSAQEKKEGFELLFDGNSMIHWKGNTKDYVAEDGCIVLYPKNKGGGNLYTKKEYDNFVYRFDFQLTPGANNGLGIRTPDEGDAAYVGMELQILDNESPIYSKLEKYQYHGSVYGVIPAKRGHLKEVGEWNSQEVVVDGDHIKITLNGEVILDGDIREASKNGTLDKRNHPGLFNKKGHIAFLGHGSEVRFKNIRVKELK